MNESLPTIFVVDDDAAVRKSLVRLLASAGYRAESFASADEFLGRWHANPVHGCVLLDISMPGLDGLQLQQVLQTSTPGIPIIFITGHGDIPSSVKAMKAGAVDFFAKPFDDENLLQAVHEAIQRDHRERAECEERAAAARLFETLTPREREVMALVVCGMLNKQVAFALGVSEKTIKIHRGRVMAKMKVQSVADLVRAAEKIGLRPHSTPSST
jgi:FixJ family two-component response regulator